ncbi:peptidoglycan editing factor PgeF [Nitrogeniibacter mangrovi]|uniref:Purine nucleoside phosphorylase n=1 Tax=Nitrogeniibacter mangrovi TaxID=2016596 RepID=A0A6C1B5V0_9RHOO|nr:peptidoglycan editing factor PgeF [Nitrogeniibacter mangrovi]QID18078.1 peptidoglycan editing factor PgeF [Nitrogeniibacter mangrovi]
MALELIEPDWPAPSSVRAVMTTRHGGVSVGPYATMNLGDHVGDDAASVAANRRRLVDELGAVPCWLSQVHGTDVVDLAEAADGVVADAAVSRIPGRACTVMTADCLPVLFCDRAGTVVAAAHAGWRGLCAGVLEATVRAMGVDPGSVLAWLGAAIGPAAFEVGEEVRTAFMAQGEAAARAFRSAPDGGKWFADLYALARWRLARGGVTAVYGGGLCTHSDADRFFSYRRTPVTGRMASLVWLR